MEYPILLVLAMEVSISWGCICLMEGKQVRCAGWGVLKNEPINGVARFRARESKCEM